MFEHLLQTGKIGKLTLKNRMKFAAANTNYCRRCSHSVQGKL